MRRRRKIRNEHWLENWVENFNQKDEEVQAALTWMVDHGCDPDVLFELLAGCTHPDTDDNPVLLRVKDSLKARLLRLRRLHRQIERTTKACHEVQTEPLFLNLHGPKHLPTALTTAYDELQELFLRLPFDNRKIPSGLARITFCLYIQRTTGKPAWTRIATLLHAGYAAHGLDRDIDPEHLSSRLRYFRRKHPELLSVLAAEADRYPNRKKGR